jgi:hypothetical protein
MCDEQQLVIVMQDPLFCSQCGNADEAHLVRSANYLDLYDGPAKTGGYLLVGSNDIRAQTDAELDIPRPGQG